MKTQGTMTLHYRTAVSASVLALVSTLPAGAQTTDTWSLGSSGLWNVASNWSADVVPNNGTPSGSTYNVNITDGKSTVTLNTNAEINDLTMGAGNTLAIGSNQTLTVDGPTIANNGAIQINAGGGYNSALQIGGNTTLNGTGTLTLAALAGGGTAYLEQATSGLTLTNQGTIQGTGIVGNGGLTVANSGTIDANSTAGIGGILLNAAGGVTNSGTLEATGGSTLTIDTNVTDTGAGKITASGAKSVVDLDGITIAGGTLTSKTGGAFATQGTNTLSGVTLAAASVYAVAPNTETNLTGPFTNDGTVTVTGGSGSNAILGINNSLTLGGPVTLSSTTNAGSAFIQETTGGVTLTTTGTVQGTGIIGNGGLLLVNSGTIDAAPVGTGTSLILNGGGITNTGTLEATGGSTLAIDSSVVNTGATITASGTGSVVGLNGITITGGTLSTSGGGTISNSGTNTLSGVTIAAGTIYPVTANTQTNLTGPITNNGTITVTGNSASNATLGINNTQTLGGTITLSSVASGGTAFIEATTGNVTLTATGTVQGAGVFGNGSLTLVNSGTVNANATGTGQSTEMLVNGGGAFTNNGTLEVASGDSLVVDTGSFTNFSGTELKGGTYNVTGTLQIDNLGSTGGEIKTNDASIILNGSTPVIEDAAGANALSKFATNAAKGIFTLANDANYTTAGNFNNLGTIAVGAGSTFKVGIGLKNFAGTTLTGGTYDLAGDLDFKGANVVTNAANITLDATSGDIVNSTGGANALANFATNSATGSFGLANAANFTTGGSFSNAGILTVGAGSTFTVGGPGAFTQTAGTTTDSGILAASGGATVSGGTLFGTGSITGNLASSGGIVNPGASAIKTGILTDTGKFTQTAGGSLDIGIGGKVAGTNYDVLDATTAALGGTLNLTQLKSYVPTVGATFKILNFNSESGTFATVNGLTINSTEAYTITYQPEDVLLTVVSTASPAAAPVAAAKPAAEVNRSIAVEIPASTRNAAAEEAYLAASQNEAARLTAAIAEFNSGYAAGGKQAVAMAKQAALSRELIQERLDLRNLVKKVKQN